MQLTNMTKTILDNKFADNGLLQADETICFEEKVELETINQFISRNFQKKIEGLDTRKTE